MKDQRLFLISQLWMGVLAYPVRQEGLFKEGPLRTQVIRQVRGLADEILRDLNGTEEDLPQPLQVQEAPPSKRIRFDEDDEPAAPPQEG